MNKFHPRDVFRDFLVTFILHPKQPYELWILDTRYINLPVQDEHQTMGLWSRETKSVSIDTRLGEPVVFSVISTANATNDVIKCYYSHLRVGIDVEPVIRLARGEQCRLSYSLDASSIWESNMKAIWAPRAWYARGDASYRSIGESTCKHTNGGIGKQSSIRFSLFSYFPSSAFYKSSTTFEF